ncbi:MAG: hypothetical protein A2Z34_04835 [Planctomycetes bacterium RBG_16_59_8]|nr:MAG: hypothetical protein A2Z34_04835 [Planctomycetes bacterium RBG_16_59_8]
MNISCPHCGKEIDSAPLPSRQTKACPYCAETIRRDAQKCRHCGEFLGYVSPGKGRGIISLLGGVFSGKRGHKNEFVHAPADKIEANPYQPRELVDKKTLADLKKSMRQYGIIVPLIVKRDGKGYQLVAGQRRLMAARELGMKFVPAIVMTLNVREMMEISYLENLHRVDLSRIDLIQMFERICLEYPEIGREKLSAMLGLDLEQITRDRDLIKLPVILQEAVRRGMVSEEHARHLRHLDGKKTIEALEEIYRHRLTAEETEELVNRLLKKQPKYISSGKSLHFHRPDCPYTNLLDRHEANWYYSKREAVKSGKRACMTCL